MASWCARSVTTHTGRMRPGGTRTREPGRPDRVSGDLCLRVASAGSVPSRLALAVGLLIVGAAADVGTTYVALSGSEYVEGSPVGRLFISRFGLLGGMLLTKAVGMAVIGIPVVVAGGTRRFVATLMCAGVGVLSLAVAARNLLFVAGLWP